MNHASVPFQTASTSSSGTACSLRSPFREALRETREQLVLEAKVYAAQLREKDVLINKLLEKVHAA